MPSSVRHLSLAFSLLAVVANLPALAAPNTRFDGRWSIEVITRAGRCDSYKWDVDIRGGRVADIEGHLVEAKGGIDARGHLGITFINGSERVTARGDVSRDSGYGTWQAPARECAGDWRATPET